MNNKTHNANNVEAIDLHEVHLQILGIKNRWHPGDLIILLYLLKILTISVINNTN